MEKQHTTAAGLRRMSDLSGYAVSDEDPDIRGWNVIGADGQIIGEVDDLLVDTAQMKVRGIDVDLKGGDHSIVPAEDVHVDRQARQVRIAGSRADAGRSVIGAAGTAPPVREREYDTERAREGRLTRSEEQLRVGTTEVQDDYVVGKHIETERVERPVTLRHEEPVIERRPVTEGTAADPHTMGSGEVRVPLVHEEATVEKQPVVKEELVIGKRVVEDEERVQADLRREEFDVKGRPDSGRARSRRKE